MLLNDYEATQWLLHMSWKESPVGWDVGACGMVVWGNAFLSEMRVTLFGSLSLGL